MMVEVTMMTISLGTVGAVCALITVVGFVVGIARTAASDVEVQPQPT